MRNNLADRATRVLAQGFPATNSKRPTAFTSNYPSHSGYGKGCYLYDTDGRRYIDFYGALGPSILGYAHPKVTEAVIAQVKQGETFSLPHYLEVEVAEEICSIFEVDKVRFFLNGFEACDAAIRIARSYLHSGHSARVISEGFHGSSDLWTSLTPPAHGVDDKFFISTTPNEDRETRGHQVFITEPVMLDMSEDRKQYLNNIQKKEWADVIIYDEIVTGLRVPKLSVKRMWDLKPDIICLGKALGNGFPISIVAGKKELMDCDYFLSRTFGAHPVSLAACQATIREIQKLNVTDLVYYAERFIKKLNEVCKEIGVEWNGYGTRCQMDEIPGRYLNGKALLMQECIKGGVFFGKAFYYGFQHLEAQIDEQVLNIVSDSVGKIRRGEAKLEGLAPMSSFKR